MKTTYTVQDATNGYLFKADQDGEETYLVGAEDETDETKGFIDFLYDILGNFGPATSRYSAKRIRIITLPGDKYEGALSEKYRQELKYLRDEITAILESKDNH